ncbi:MAG: protein kinase [Planctomycetota bacterium]
MALDPNRFDEFIIESMIGEGGMGKVYRARQTALDRWVALKVLPRAKENANFKERFFREARSAARLVHPNIIQIHTVGEMQGVPYFTMEYVEGDDLEHIIRAGDLPLSNDCIIEIARSVVKAMAVASEQGVVHRDIKPANIMISKTGLVKVMDFGLAKELDHNITQSGVVVGTPTYMSPEQGSGQTVDFRSDLYSLGCVLYECVKGQPPFHAEKVATVIYKHMFEPPPPLSDADHPVDPVLETFIMKTLAKKPEERFQAADGVLEALSKMPYNSAAAEIALSRHAQKSLRAKKLIERPNIALDPDAPTNLVPQLAVPIKNESNIHPTDVMPETVERKALPRSEPVKASPSVAFIPPAQVAPLGQMLAERAKFLNPAKIPTQPVPPLPADETATPPQAPTAGPRPGFLQPTAPVPQAPPPPVVPKGRISSPLPIIETVSQKPPPKPLNLLKPPPKPEHEQDRRDPSGVLRKPSSSNAVRKSSILDEAEVIQKKASLPIMRVQLRPASVAPYFSKLTDGRWSYAKMAARCERAEGLAKILAPIPTPEGKDRGLGDCLLCPNWNKRVGCAVAFNEELLVKGRYTGIKLLSEQAVVLMGAGRFDQAIELFNDFIADNPNNPYGYRELARIYDRPDYKGKDKRRGIILYLRYVELAREQNEGSKIEISRAEARANAMKALPASAGGSTIGEALEFDCFYRGDQDCYVYARIDMLNLVAVKAGVVDPQTGVSEPDPNAGVSAFRRAKSIFSRAKTEQEKQEDQSAVRKELTRLADLDTPALKKDPNIICLLSMDTLGSMEAQFRPPDLSILKCTDKSGVHSFVFTGSNAFEGMQGKEFFRRRMGLEKRLDTVRI